MPVSPTFQIVENEHVRRRVTDIVGGLLRSVADRMAPPRAAVGPAAAPAPTAPPATRRVSAKGVAAAAVAKAFNEAAAKRSAPEVPGAGNGQDYSAYHPINREQQRIVSSRDALRGRVFTRAGTTPFEYHPEITLDYIASVHREIDNSGRCERLADLNTRILREDAHTQSVDRLRRAIHRYPLLWKPRNRSTLARLCCYAVQAMVEDIDSFQRASGEILISNSAGFGAMEMAWDDRKIQIPTGKNTALALDVFTVTELQGVKNRWFWWDIQTDRPYVDMGGRRMVDPNEDPETGERIYKLLTHISSGDAGQAARHRGYQYANSLLFALKGLGVEKWATLIESCSVPTIYVQAPPNGKIPSPEEIDDTVEVMQDMGKGKPGMLHPDIGDIKISPIPTVNALHPGIIGYLEQCQSKLVLSSTLQVEVNNVGSYAAAETHADGQEAVMQIDSDLQCETYRNQLARALLALNAERFARSFAPYCEGRVTPDDVRALVPSCYREIRRATTQTERMSVFVMAHNSKIPGLEVDAEQVAEEMQLRRPQADLVPLAEQGDTADPVEASKPLIQLGLQTRGMAIPGQQTAALMMLLPPDAASILDPHRLPGYEKPLHVTVAVFDRGRDLSQLGYAIKAALEGFGPLAGTVGGPLQQFDAVGDGAEAPAWAAVDVPMLPMCRAQVIAATMLAGIATLDNAQDYVPHCTMGYVPADSEPPTAEVPIAALNVTSLALCAGGEVLARFPL